jgi:hypothetical protein
MDQEITLAEVLRVQFDSGEFDAFFDAFQGLDVDVDALLHAEDP